MITPGLVSISFRQLDVDTVIKLCVDNELEAIEWGGDVHVPHGNLDVASATREKSHQAGLQIAAYGSYYRCSPSDDELNFESVLATAVALGAPVIRVWAGQKGSCATSESERQSITDDLRRIGRLAQGENIEIAIEFHENTLTDNPSSALQLVRVVNLENVKLYWQTTNRQSRDYSQAALETLLPFVSHVHVFNWEFENDAIIRRPLSEAEEAWMNYLKTASNKDRCALLEFVRDDSPQQLADDARTLRRFLAQLR